MRTLALVIALGCLFSVTADAQILDTDSEGYPIQVRVVIIDAGEFATISTDYNLASPTGGYADTVITLWDIADNQTVAGADGWNCIRVIEEELPSLAPSCFHYQNNTSSARAYLVIARAWQTWTPALTRILKNGVPLPGHHAELGPLPAGGGVTNVQLEESGRQHYTTAHQTGDNDQHMMLVVQAPWNYVIERIVSAGSGPVGGLATLDIWGLGGLSRPDLTLVFGGVNPDNQGAIRLLKNDWFDGECVDES